MIALRKRGRAAVLALAAVAGVLLTLSLGFWQLDRARQKQARQDQLQAQDQRAELDGRSLLDGAITDLHTDWLQRRMTVRGTWLSAHTVFLDNRPMDGRVGFWVVTPLQIEGSDRVLLVQRGWTPRDFQDRSRLPELRSDDTARVQLTGRLVAPPSRLLDLGAVARTRIRQNLDLDDYRQETGRPVLSVSLQQLSDTPDGLLRHWSAPDFGVDKHLGYAFQWFALAGLISVFYVWFQIVRRPLPLS